MRRTTVVIAILLAVAAPLRAQDLSLSHDLLRLGIARANIEPDRPDVDAVPLFDAAVGYLRTHPGARVTLDPGSYYFLTKLTNGRHIYIQGLQDITFDFGGANLFFRDPYALDAMQIVGCQRVTFANFTVDYLDLPFTQVRVAQVSPSDRTIRYEPLPGYRNATDFNNLRSSNGAVPELLGLAFRNGAVVTDTGRFHINRPIGGDTLQAANDGYWTDPSALQNIQPGDTLVIFGRNAAGLAVRIDGGRDVAFQGVDIYASSAIGILFVGVGAARVDGVRVMPRPGTDRLIATNADGINLTNVQDGSAVRNSEVHRTLDDGIAVNSTYLASTVSAPAPNVLTLTREAQSAIPNGTNVSLVNAATGEELAAGHVVSQTPPYVDLPASGDTMQVTFDAGLPSVPRDSGLVFADPAQRGAGTVVENNLVEDVQFARGIYVAGPIGVTVQNNIVRRTTSGGIILWEANNVPGFAVPPVHNIQILGNVIEQPIGVGTVATGSFGAFGGISVVSAANGSVVAGRVNSNIVIAGNRVSDSGRSGIWVGSIAGGSITHNVIERPNRRPGLPLVGVQRADQAQLTRDFTQAVVVRNSDGVDVGDNDVAP